ncbi:MAG: hypothetical protein RL341_1902 [Pseudomonadota bacterium]|jgi:hypothetical protein
MANKSHSTRQKLTFKLPVAKPRNPLVVPAGKRKAGSHAPDPSAVRQAEKRKLKKLLDES